MCMKESDLMEYVRADFEEMGYTTYAEVCINGGGSSRCDMYAKNENKSHELYGHTIVFEAKLTFNLKVIEQAEFWKNKAHDTYVVVPSTSKNIKSRRFARHICSALGIGVLEVNINQGKYYMSVKSKRCDKPKYPKLYDEQKLTLASNSSNEFVTPFKITLKRINEYMLDKDKVFLTSLTKDVQHHYKTNLSANNAIRFLIEQNVIKGFYMSKEKNKLVINKYGF